MPFLNDGYYASVIAGHDHWRARFVLTEITTPDLVTQSGFEDNDLSVRAYIVDYYFSPGFTGWWVLDSMDCTRKYDRQLDCRRSVVRFDALL